ncbi:MAG: LicD family protein [Sporichthyaceae bacterium]
MNLEPVDLLAATHTASVPAQRRPSADQTALSAADVRRIQLEILRTFDAFCSAHNLRYYLAYGTLLGAVRHGGFIPWDDDVDVMMPRTDYERFVSAFAAEPNRRGLQVRACSNTPGWPYPFAKVVDLTTTLHEGVGLPPLGVNIDVFPVDGLPNLAPLRSLDGRLIGVLRTLHAAKMVVPRAGRARARVLLVQLAQSLLRPLAADRLGAAWNRRATRPLGPRTRAVGVRVGPHQWAVPTAALGEPVRVRFAGLELAAPADTALVLRTVYGEYMQLPLENRRVSHHVFTAHRGPCSALFDPPCPP